MSEPENPV